MLRTTVSITLIASILACSASSAPVPADIPVGRSVSLTQALTMVELRFSNDSDKLLVVKHFGEGTTPLVTIHNVKREPDMGGSIYFPLGYPELFVNTKVPFDFRRNGVSALFSPDGNTLATCSFKAIRLWNIRKGQNGRWWPTAVTLDVPGSAKAVFTKDGKRILTAAVSRVGQGKATKFQYEVLLWDAATGKPIGEPGRDTYIPPRGYLNPGDPVIDLFFTPDETSFLTGGQWWDAKTLKPIGDRLRPVGGGLGHRFGHDGKTLLTVSTQQITLWDLVNHKPLCTLPTPDVEKEKTWYYYVSAKSRPWFAVHPNGTSALYTKGDQVKLWDLNGEKPVEKLTLEHPGQFEGRVYWVAISHDGKLAATARDHSDEVLVWSLETGKPVLKLQHKEVVMAMEFSPDGRILATADAGDVQLWKLDIKK